MNFNGSTQTNFINTEIKDVQETFLYLNDLNEENVENTEDIVTFNAISHKNDILQFYLISLCHSIILEIILFWNLIY